MKKSVKERIDKPRTKLDIAIANASKAALKRPKPRSPRAVAAKAPTPQTLRTKYSEIVATHICNRLAAGESLKKICETEGYPAPHTVNSWVQFPDETLRPGFVEKYLQAREIGYIMMGDEIIDIADDSGKDKIKRRVNGKEIEIVDLEHIQRDKMRIQVRQWTLEKKLPRIYGQSMRVDHTVNINLNDRMTAARERVSKLRSNLTIDTTAEEV